MMNQLRARPDTFIYLDVAQLVKHAFGLSNRFGERETFLLYLFWEPANRDSFPEFEQHRQEVAQFAASVAGSSVHFVWRSYPELWCEWARSDQPWLKQHVQTLSRRYAVSI